MFFIWLSMYLARKYYLRKPFLHLVQEIGPPSYVAIRSPRVTEMEFRNPRNFACGILNSSFEIGSTAQGIQNPTNVWNPKFKFHWKRLESSTCSPESTAWNPESRVHKWKRFPQLHGASSSHTSIWKTKTVPLYLSSFNIFISVITQ